MTGPELQAVLSQAATALTEVQAGIKPILPELDKVYTTLVADQPMMLAIVQVLGGVDADLQKYLTAAQQLLAMLHQLTDNSPSLTDNLIKMMGSVEKRTIILNLIAHLV